MAEAVSQARALVSKAPRGTQATVIAVCACFVIGLLPMGSSLLAFIPIRILPPYFHLWNLLSASFFEVSPLALVADIGFFLMAGAYLEVMWGTAEYCKFVLLVSLGCSGFTFLWFTFLWAFTGELELMMSHPEYGCAGLIVGMCVAMKQVNPEHQLWGFLRFKNVPMVLLLAYVVSKVLGGVDALPFAVSGLLTSWLYLRFYQVHSDGTVGDPTEPFCFASFFPEPVRPLVRLLTRPLGRLGALCGFKHSPSSMRRVPGRMSSVGDIEEPLPEVTLRHMAVAEEVLDRRLAALDKHQQTQQTTPSSSSTSTTIAAASSTSTTTSSSSAQQQQPVSITSTPKTSSRPSVSPPPPSSPASPTIDASDQTSTSGNTLSGDPDR